jgi:signal transduction histidine kinase
MTDTQNMPLSDDGAEQPAHLFEAVARIGPRLASIRSLRRLLSESVDLIRTAFGLDSVVLYLLDEEHHQLLPVGNGDGRLSENHPAAERALEEHKTIHVVTSFTQVEVALPLTFEQHSLGALVMRGNQSARLASDLPAFELVADQLAVAIHNARMYQRDVQVLASAERRAKLLEAATLVSRDVTSILDLDVLLERIVDAICLVYGFYYAAIFMVDPRLKRWAVLRAGYGDAGRQMLESGYLLEINNHSMVGWCITHREARIALDVGFDAVRFNNPLLPLTRSEMALPLVIGEEVIGALSVQSAQESAFDDKDTTTLQVLADQIAIVIHNAQLLDDVRNAHRELVRTKTFEAIAAATGEAIHWVDNKAAPIRACVTRTREDLARLIYMADALIRQAPPELREHLYGQMIADAAETLDEHFPAKRELLAELEGRPFKSVRRMLSMESILEDLGIIEQSAGTILNIKEDLIGPARETRPMRIAMDEFLRQLVASMAISSDVQIVQHYAPDLPRVYADARQLENVFRNLIKNAVEAMFERPEKRLTLETVAARDGTLVVRIADTGCGISPADLDRIWIAFYTTKGNRGGTGLGLSACMQIVSQMEGKIAVESVVNVGTAFTVTLPAPPE